MKICTTLLLAGLEAHILQATKQKFLWDLRKKNMNKNKF